MRRLVVFSIGRDSDVEEVRVGRIEWTQRSKAAALTTNATGRMTTETDSRKVGALRRAVEVTW